MKQARVTVTRTYSLLHVNRIAYNVIAEKLREAGYDHAFHDESGHGTVIDMHGIALAVDTDSDKTEA